MKQKYNASLQFPPTQAILCSGRLFNIDCILVLIFFSFWREMTTINLCI